MRSRIFNPPIDFDRRWARDEARKHPGRTYEQARELWRLAAKSAAICGKCFRPLLPTDSVTMEGRKIGKHYWVRVPICLLCTLDDIKLERWRGCDSFYREPHWHRTRCLNCSRPLRIWFTPGYERRPGRNARTCCEDCERLAKNKRNKLRRRVKHQPVTCIKCGRSFTPTRDDALTCSNRCRQALHRERARVELGDSSYPLRKQPDRGHRRTPR
jgi:hypothetical protein